jgi:hypothetical protein
MSADVNVPASAPLPKSNPYNQEMGNNLRGRDNLPAQ